jgi:hypothetical protein
MRNPIRIIVVFALLTGGMSACKGNEKSATSAAKAVDVAITPTGEAQVTLKDDKGQLVAASDVTGKVELADGQTIPLTPDADGKMLRAPMGAHMGDTRHCMANVRVKMPGGAEHVKQVDLCREHARHGHDKPEPGMRGGHGDMPGGHGSSHE